MAESKEGGKEGSKRVQRRGTEQRQRERERKIKDEKEEKERVRAERHRKSLENVLADNEIHFPCSIKEESNLDFSTLLRLD